MSVVPYPFLNGLLNNLDPLFHIQVYVWLLIFLGILCGAEELFFRVTFWNPMTPWHGLFKAWKRKSYAAFICDLKLNWDLTDEAGAKLIFDKERYDLIGISSPNDPFKKRLKARFDRFRAWLFDQDFSIHIAKKLQRDWDDAPLVTIGSVPTDLIYDFNHWTDVRSRDREAIAKCVETYNENEIQNNNNPDEIHSLIKFIRYARADPPKIICPGIELTKKIPITRVEDAFPVRRHKAAWAGFLRQMAEEELNKPNKDINKYAIIVIAASVALDVLFVGVSFILS